MSKDIQPAEVAKIRAAANKATKGPWEHRTGKVVIGAYILAECSYENASFIALTDPTTIIAMCDALEASPWISVEDRLPEKGIAVYVINPCSSCIAEITRKGEWYVHSPYALKPTHWMPIPPLPERQ